MRVPILWPGFIMVETALTIIAGSGWPLRMCMMEYICLPEDERDSHEKLFPLPGSKVKVCSPNDSDWKKKRYPTEDFTLTFSETNNLCVHIFLPNLKVE